MLVLVLSPSLTCFFSRARMLAAAFQLIRLFFGLVFVSDERKYLADCFFERVNKANKDKGRPPPVSMVRRRLHKW